jgi:small subunit ribosomal protein S4e
MTRNEQNHWREKMHIKRKASPKTWPVHRKGTKYIVVPNEKGLPLLIAMREILQVAQTKKEAKKIIHENNVHVNGSLVKDEKYALKLFDVLKLQNKEYRVSMLNKKYAIQEISEKESKTKIAKIIGKKLLRGKKIQVNLSDGRNYILAKDCKIGDSAVINLAEKKIEHFIPLKEKSKVFVSSGKHMGKTGTVESINKNLAAIKSDSEKINVNLESLIALE